jgi:hypothetical protein
MITITFIIISSNDLPVGPPGQGRFVVIIIRRVQMDVDKAIGK